MKFLELSLNHKELLRFSVPKLGAALPMDSTEQEQQRLAGWGRGAADGTGTGLQSCFSAQSPSAALSDSSSREAGSWSSSGSGCKPRAQGTVGVWE